MLQTRSPAGALEHNAAGAQRCRRVDPSRKKLVARAKRGSRALTRRGECQMFLCELPAGSEHAASRAKQQATVKYMGLWRAFLDIDQSLGRVKRSDLVQSGRNTSPGVVGAL